MSQNVKLFYLEDKIEIAWKYDEQYVLNIDLELILRSTLQVLCSKIKFNRKDLYWYIFILLTWKNHENLLSPESSQTQLPCLLTAFRAKYWEQQSNQQQTKKKNLKKSSLMKKMLKFCRIHVPHNITTATRS